jgi:hypothetical protein
MNVALVSPPTDVQPIESDGLRAAHVRLIAALAGLNPPTIPIGVQSQDVLALALYESCVLENVRRHLREVIAVAKENGVGGVGELGKDADAALADMQSGILGVFEIASERV